MQGEATVHKLKLAAYRQPILCLFQIAPMCPTHAIDKAAEGCLFARILGVHACRRYRSTLHTWSVRP
eukprot:scaffold162995_cov22-Tisochrysis_lutea.AAC.2